LATLSTRPTRGICSWHRSRWHRQEMTTSRRITTDAPDQLWMSPFRSRRMA
jgi:hypothetical protein